MTKPEAPIPKLTWTRETAAVIIPVVKIAGVRSDKHEAGNTADWCYGFDPDVFFSRMKTLETAYNQAKAKMSGGRHSIVFEKHEAIGVTYQVLHTSLETEEAYAARLKAKTSNKIRHAKSLEEQIAASEAALEELKRQRAKLTCPLAAVASQAK
jgi:hypothetical protein